MEFKDLDELLDLLANYAYSLHEKGDIDTKECAVLLDTFKMAMGEYAHLLDAGKIPENRQFKFDFAKGIDIINEALEDEEL